MSRNRILQHPDEYREDLNPDYEAGENRGPIRYETRTAHEIKDLHERLRDLRDDELKAIPILVEGSRLAQGATYFDLRYPERGEFKALGSMTAGPDNWYVPKTEVDYRLWNLIAGEDDPDRLSDLASEEDRAHLRRRQEG
jgi:hypothetical protein